MPLSIRLERGSGFDIALTPSQKAVRERIEQRLKDKVYRMETVPCFCGEARMLCLTERDYYGLPYELILCPDCGLIRNSPRLDAVSSEQFFREDYWALIGGEETETMLFEHQLQKGRVFAGNLKELPGTIQTIYQLDAGPGGMMKPFLEAGIHVIGTERSPEMAEAGRKRGFDIVTGGLDQLLDREHGKLADLILLVESLERMGDLRKELASVMRGLRPGGLLWIEVPGVGSISDVYAGDLLSYFQFPRKHYFTAPTLRYVLGTLGLEMIYNDEQVVTVAQKPMETSRMTMPLKPKDESTAILGYLQDLETKTVRKLQSV